MFACRTGSPALLILGLALAGTPVCAQGSAEEVRLVANATSKLHRHAQLWFKAGFYRRAAQVWREAVSEYDENHEPSWKALGYARFGTVWTRDEKRPYPQKDTGKPAKAKSLESKWRALARGLGERHRKLALALQKAGDDERALHHMRRLLRFVPDSREAGEALGYGTFAGLYGTAEELAILARSLHLRQTVEYLKRKRFPVERLPNDAAHPLIDRKRYEYRGVRSENFKVWGNVHFSHLKEAAETAERCLRLCRTAFWDRRNYGTETTVTELAFFNEQVTWRSILEDNRGLFADTYLKFLLDNCASAYLNEGGERLYVVAEHEHAKTLDYAARAVAVDLGRMQSAALDEGVGHALVGMLLGRNLNYFVHPEVEEQGKRTVSGSKAPAQQGPVLHPDMAVWRGIAIGQAWQKESTAAAEIPLIPADRLKVTQRVKAWSFCDYLIRREPDLLRYLDEASEGAGSAGEVEKEFTDQTDGVPLRQIEDAWRTFWREDTRLLAAAMKPAGKAPRAEQKVTPWMDAINDVRDEYGLNPVGWVKCENPGRAEYARAMRKGTPLSGSAAAFARHALWAPGGTPSAELRQWLHRPGYRHALLNPDVSMFGWFAAGPAVVLDVSSEAMSRPRKTQLYPLDDQESVPTQVAVAALGSSVQALLQKHGKAEVGRIGYPVSLHVFGTYAEISAVECLVRCGGKDVEGVLHSGGAEGGDRMIEAPGLWTFFPFAPFESDAQVRVTWSWNQGEAARRVSRDTFFKTK